MACATVPKIVLTTESCQRGGVLRDGRSGLRSELYIQLANSAHRRDGGRSAVVAIHGPELERLKREKKPVPQELQDRIARTQADYERWLDARHAAARGHVDALIDPLMTRRVLQAALETTLWKYHSEHTVLETLGG